MALTSLCGNPINYDTDLIWDLGAQCQPIFYFWTGAVGKIHLLFEWIFLDQYVPTVPTKEEKMKSIASN